MKNKNPGPTP